VTVFAAGRAIFNFKIDLELLTLGILLTLKIFYTVLSED
jgi:hypothetical protein